MFDHVTSVSIAPEKFAERKFALVKFAPLKFELCASEPLRFALVKLSFEKSPDKPSFVNVMPVIFELSMVPVMWPTFMYAPEKFESS